MDSRALAAVFVTLAAVFMGMNGGFFSASDVRDVQSEAGISAPETPSARNLGKNLPLIGEYLERPEPKHEIRAVVQAGEETALRLRDAEVEAAGLRRLETTGISVESDEDMELRGFTGDLKYGNTTSISGSASGIVTSGVNLSTGVNLDTEYRSDRIEVRGTDRTDMEFSSASISPFRNSDFPINNAGVSVEIESFQGDFTLYPGNRSLVLDGMVHRVRAGKTTFGAE